MTDTMNGMRDIGQQLQGRNSPSAAARRQEPLENWPFLVVVTIVLLILFGVILGQRPELRALPQIIWFTGLIALHLALYWLVLRLPDSLPWQIAYLAIQATLAFALSLLARDAALTFGLYAPLIGLAVGIFRKRRLAALVIVALLGLYALSAIRLSGLEILPVWLVIVLPTSIFVIIYVELYSRQAEARAEAQAYLAELQLAHAQLAEYAVEVEALTLAAERQRMARELHDTLAQGLVGLILQLEAGQAQLEQGRAQRAAEIIEQAMVRARQTLAEARRAIGDLREQPAASGDLALAVRQEVERFIAATGIPCALDIALPANVPQRTGGHARRIVAEALANVARHAQASQAWVTVAIKGSSLEIEVRDNGAGFDPANSRPGAGHYGLLGMQERARLAGGKLDIRSAPGQGVTVRLSLPLETPDSETGSPDQHD